MLGRRGQPTVAADDVADAHRVIVDGEGEMVGGEAIRLEEHVVVERLIAKGDRAHHQVLERRRAIDGDGLAHDEALTGGGAPV